MPTPGRHGTLRDFEWHGSGTASPGWRIVFFLHDPSGMVKKKEDNHLAIHAIISMNFKHYGKQSILTIS